MADSKGRAFGRSSQRAKTRVELVQLISSGAFWKVAEVLRTSAKTILQQKKFSRTDCLQGVNSKIIRWMIFDGKNLFLFIWRYYSMRITQHVRHTIQSRQLPVSTGRVLTYSSIYSASCPYLFKYFFLSVTGALPPYPHELFVKSSCKNFIP